MPGSHAQKINKMKTGPFKLRSGNKPSIAKLSGISPVKQKKIVLKKDTPNMDVIMGNNAEYKYDKERNRRLDILDQDYPEIVSQKGSPGTGYKKIKGTNIYKHPLGMKKGREERDPNLRYTFFGDTEKNRFEY